MRIDYFIFFRTTGLINKNMKLIMRLNFEKTNERNKH
jgi:hypothetical protein